MMINEILLGDSKEIAKDIPDESLDMGFCDPVYQNMEDYSWLAETAQRVLKPDKPLIVFCSSQKMKETRDAMDPYLTFQLPMFYIVKAKMAFLNAYHAFTWTTPMLVYSKGKYAPKSWYIDTFISVSRPSGTHKWNKNVGILRYYIDRISYPNDIIWDPFAGHGSIPYVCVQAGRRFVASEIDEECVNFARNRVAQVRKDLF